MARFDLNQDPDLHEATASRRASGNQEQARPGANDRMGTRAETVEGAPRKTSAHKWFFAALIGGGIGLFVIKRVSTNAWFAAFFAFVVVLLLSLYYMFNDKDAPEEEGDNVYYLGLLFTLLSLVFTLLELFGIDADGPRSAESIRALLENFGIALTSTMTGIAGRVLVQNWQLANSSPWRRRAQWIANRLGIQDRQGPETAENPDSSTDAAAPPPPPASASFPEMEGINRYLLGRIARDLTLGANALARFHRIVRSHATGSENFLLEHSGSLKRESTAFKDRLQSNAELFAQELKSEAENVLNAVGGSLAATAKQAEALLRRLESAHDDHLAKVREASRSFLDEMQAAGGENLDILQRNFGAAAEQSQSLVRSMSAIHEQVSKDFLLEHSESLKRENTAFKDRLQRDTETFAQKLKGEAENVLGAVGGSLAATAKQAEDLLQRLESTHDNHLAKVREASRSFLDEMQAASGANLDSMQRNFEAATQQSQSLARDMSAVHKQMDELLERLESHLGRAGDAGAAFGSNAHQAAKSIEVLESEAEKLQTSLVGINTVAKAMTGMLNAMDELQARIGAGQDTERTAAAVQQIGETLQAITAEGATATKQAAQAGKLLDALTQSARATEEETKHAAEALRNLADEAKMQAEILRRDQVSKFRFWNRGQ